MRRGFAPHFRHLDDLFAPQNLTLSTILFRSCWVPFRSPPFSACRRSFCPQNWPNLSFYSDLVGSHFELRAVHPYWFWPGVPPPGCHHCVCWWPCTLCTLSAGKVMTLYSGIIFVYTYAQPMRDVVTVLRRLLLAGPIYEMIPIPYIYGISTWRGR